MTTVTVPAEPRPVPALVVDPEGIRDCGADLRAASAQIDDLGTFVAGGARIGDWNGLGATSYHDAIGPTGRRADAMSLALRAVARRVDAHADEMTRLGTGRDDLVDARGALVRAIAALRAEIAVATEADAARLQLESDALLRRVTAFEQDLTTWADEVRAEESAMIEAFGRVLTLEQVERTYGGVTDPADGALATKPPAGARPEQVNDWWDGLTREQQLAVIVAAPGAIGNLPGTLSRDRHAANTVALDRDLADPTCPWLDNARAADEARREIASRTDPVTGEPITAQIYLYDPAAFDGDGRIAISAGDLGTADNVAVVVPGLGTDVTSAVPRRPRGDPLRSRAHPRPPPDQRDAVLDRLRRPRQRALGGRLGRGRGGARGPRRGRRRPAGRHHRRAAGEPRWRPGPPHGDRAQLRVDHCGPRRPRRGPGSRRHRRGR